MKKILLLGVSLNSDNLGVNALGIGAISLLKRSFRDIDIEILSVGSRDSVRNKLNINNEEITVTTHYFSGKDFVISLFKKNDEINSIYKRNDVIYDVNEGDSFSDIYGYKRLIRHSIDSYLAIRNNKNIIFLPQTIGPFDTLIGKSLSKYILRNVKEVYVRDNKANSLLNSIDVEYKQSIDMAVWMTPKKYDFDVKPKTVGINISGLMYSNAYKSLENKYSSYKTFIIKLVESFITNNIPVLLVPHTYNIDTPSFEDDFLAIKSFLEENDLNNNDLVSFIDNDIDAQEVKYVISKVDFFLGSRMHSCIAALSSSVPTIGLSYSYKFEGTFEMFGTKDQVYSLSNLKESEIKNLVASLTEEYQNREEIRKVLQDNYSNRKKLELN